MGPVARLPMYRRVSGGLAALALGCAGTPARSAATSPDATPALTAPPAASAPASASAAPAAPSSRFAQPPPGAASQRNAHQGVTLTIQASRTTIHAGQRVDLVVTLDNGTAGAVWTHPSIICTGSWDFIVRDVNGDRVRVDDRDMMGCPSGGLLQTRVAPSSSIDLKLGWDGTVRKRPPGGAHPAPRGSYDIEATARWSDRDKTPNAPGPHAFMASAHVTVKVISNVPPPKPKPKPPPPKPVTPPPPAAKVPPRDDLRQRLADFTPPPQVVVTGPAGKVTVDTQDVKNARAAIAAISKQRMTPAQRRAAIAQVLADFRQRHGVTLRDVDLAVARLRNAHRKAVIADIARRHHIQHPHLRSWGPAGSGLGIAGEINGQPVILVGSKLYRGKDRPPHYFEK